MKDINDILLTAFGVSALLILLVVTVMAMSGPNKLENGCIVYNDKVYCEEINKIGCNNE